MKLNGFALRSLLYYSHYNACVFDVPGCVSCDSVDKTQCIGCQIGMEWDGIKCVRTCPNGGRLNGSYGCEDCQNNCKTCSDSGLDCYSCYQSHPFLKN